MIIFRGQDLETVAPVKIADIHVSPIQRNIVARDRPILAGADFVRVSEGTRTVTITFSILEQNPIIRQQHLEAVTAWAVSTVPGPMVLPYHQNRQLYVLCTGLPTPSARQWWESGLTLTFTAYDPYFRDEYTKEESCGTEFYVGGNAPPMMRIERTLNASASNQSYSDGINTMTFSTIPAGYMMINLNQERQTAQVDNTSIMPYFSLLSSFIVPKLGYMTITGTGTVKWKERWDA